MSLLLSGHIPKLDAGGGGGGQGWGIPTNSQAC